MLLQVAATMQMRGAGIFGYKTSIIMRKSSRAPCNKGVGDVGTGVRIQEQNRTSLFRVRRTGTLVLRYTRHLFDWMTRVEQTCLARMRNPRDAREPECAPATSPRREPTHKATLPRCVWLHPACPGSSAANKVALAIEGSSSMRMPP